MTTQCVYCGTETNLPNTYFNERRTFRIRVKKVCPPCWERRLITVLRRMMALRIFVLIVAVGLAIYAPTRLIGTFLLNVVLLQLALYLSLIAHEFGHLAAAKALGMRVFRVVLGRGKTLITKSILAVPVDVNTFPIDGFVVAGHTSREWFRLKKFVFALAGPLTNGLIAFLLWKIGGLVMPHEFSGLFEGLHPLVVLFLANVFICGVNLVPYTHLMAIGPIQSDGAQIINAPFIKSAAIDDSIFWTLTREVHECCLQRKYDLASEILREGVGRYPDRPVLPFLQGAVALGLQKWEESRQYSLAAVGQLSSTPFLEALAQMNIAYANAMLARPELSQEADQLSAKSMSASGWAPAVKTARGMVLVQHGELEEGRRLLEQSCNSTQDPVHRAENKCWIAIAAVRQGQIEEAQHYLAEARTLDPACPVLDRTEEALRTRESRSPWSRNAAH